MQTINKLDRDKFKDSKYVQSHLEDIFNKMNNENSKQEFLTLIFLKNY